jgi:hypothetical protein
VEEEGSRKSVKLHNPPDLPELRRWLGGTCDSRAKQVLYIFSEWREPFYQCLTQLGREPALEAGSRRFESYSTDQLNDTGSPARVGPAV